MTENQISAIAQVNMDVLRTWVDAINRNDVEAELACWQPDGEHYVVPTGTTYTGVDQIREAGKNSAAAVGGQPIQGRKQITHLDAGDDWAVVEYRAEATIAGPLQIQSLTLIPAGASRTVITKACLVFEMKGGKLYRGREFFDALSMAQQLGLDRETLARLYASLSTKAGEPHPAPAVPSPLETVQRFFDAWNRKDLDGLVDLLDEQVAGRNPLSPQENPIPRETARQMLANNMQAFPDLHMRIDSIAAEGEIVTVEELETATLAATGKSYTLPVACIFRVNAAGKITQMHNYWDTQAYFQQLGTDPASLAKLLS